MSDVLAQKSERIIINQEETKEEQSTANSDSQTIKLRYFWLVTFLVIAFSAVLNLKA